MIKTHNKKWWDYWRHYKTKSGARKYAEKNTGVWAVMECSPDIMTDQELEDLGPWVVGRADEYIFFQEKHGTDFNKHYRTIEIWKNHQKLIVIDPKTTIDVDSDSIDALESEIEIVNDSYILDEEPEMKSKLEQLADTLLLTKFGL